MSIIDPTPRRTKQINILLTEDEKKRLDAAVNESEMTLADFVRQAINDYAKKVKKARKNRR